MDVEIVRHSLIAERLSVLRDVSTSNEIFRKSLHDISLLLIYEALRELPMEDKEIYTPLAPTTGHYIANSPLLVPVVRAGLGMLSAAMTLLPQSSIGFLGARRDEETFQPEIYLDTIPAELHGGSVIILDPMLATGGSLLHVLEIVAGRNVGEITVVCVLAAPEGIERISTSSHSGKLFVGAVDEKLNESAYILPGLGDAGDRQFGTM